MTTCLHCGADQPTEVQRGPLLVRTDAHEAFWRGVRLDIRPTHARILGVLARRGEASRLSLEMLSLGEETLGSTLYAHICHMRPLLPDGLRIVTMRGFGYRLELGE